MDDVDVHLLLFPYSISTSMGKKVNATKQYKRYRFRFLFGCVNWNDIIYLFRIIAKQKGS
jgi:hypothetical protein